MRQKRIAHPPSCVQNQSGSKNGERNVHYDRGRYDPEFQVDIIVLNLVIAGAPENSIALPPHILQIDIPTDIKLAVWLSKINPH